MQDKKLLATLISRGGSDLPWLHSLLSSGADTDAPGDPVNSEWDLEQLRATANQIELLRLAASRLARGQPLHAFWLLDCPEQGEPDCLLCMLLTFTANSVLLLYADPCLKRTVCSQAAHLVEEVLSDRLHLPAGPQPDAPSAFTSRLSELCTGLCLRPAVADQKASIQASALLVLTFHSAVGR